MNRSQESRTRQRRAFTLIELLVVIAIIAILAAILFPVFAQAKAAAKGSASLSNAKQTSLAVIMYSGDVDDTSPPATVWPDDAPLCFGKGACFAPWSYITVPYTKNGDIYQDPLPGGDNGFAKYGGYGLSKTVWKEFFPAFGYDAALMNKQVNANGVTYWDGASMTSFSRPADMVMMTESVLNDDSGYYPFYAYSHIMNFATVEGPYCFNGCSDLWYGEWFTNPTGYGYGGAKNFNDGANTGGVAFRRGGMSNTGFIDGHVKSMSAGSLAIGTNWNPKISYGQVSITDKDSFRWYQY